MGGFASAGLLVGLGQGVSKAGEIVARRRTEDREQRRYDTELQRQRERDAREEERLSLAEQRERNLMARTALAEKNDFVLKGGRVVRANGTEGIGSYIGTSTASSQPSEYGDDDVEWETVGEIDGEQWQLPKDRLTPAERLKERGRKSRGEMASTAFPNLHLSPGQLAALSDPEQGDQLFQEYTRQNFELDPANVANKAKIAGATAQARFPYSATANKNDTDGETPAQQRATRNQFITNARSNETQARIQMDSAKPVKKADFGWDDGFRGANAVNDSLKYERANRNQFAQRQTARFRGVEHGFAADSATRAGQGGITPEQAGQLLQKQAREAYEDAFREAETPEEQREAERLYRAAEERALRMMGRAPARRKTGGGSSF